MTIVDVTRDKNPDQMNGFEGGKYYILVTAYAPDSLYLKKYIRSENNICIYDKIEDASQRSSGSLVPSLLNDSSSNPFLTQPQTVVKKNDSAKSDGTKASVRKGENAAVLEVAYRQILARIVGTTEVFLYCLVSST